MEHGTSADVTRKQSKRSNALHHPTSAARRRTLATESKVMGSTKMNTSQNPIFADAILQI